MSDFIDGIVTVVSFLCKSIAAALCTCLLAVSIVDVTRWPEWFTSVKKSASDGFGAYCGCCLMSFLALWVDTLTAFPLAIVMCSWRAPITIKLIAKNFNDVDDVWCDTFYWNVDVRGIIWWNFLLLIADLPFILFAAAHVYMPWRLPMLIRIIYLHFSGTDAVGYGEFRLNIFLNFVVGFWDIATVFLGLLTIFSPIRLVMWVRECRRYSSTRSWDVWALPEDHVNTAPRAYVCVAGLLVIPDWFAMMGYALSLPFVWNWRACYGGHYRKSKYETSRYGSGSGRGTLRSDKGREEELFLSPRFFYQGWLYAGIGLLDVLIAPMLLLVGLSWRSVRLYRQAVRHWAEEAAASAAKYGDETATAAANETNFALYTPPAAAGGPTTTASPAASTTAADATVSPRADPFLYETDWELRGLIVRQFLLLLSDLVFILMFSVTCVLLLRSYAVCRRMNKVRTSPSIRGHSKRGWYYCNYRRVIAIEFAKTFLLVLALPLVLLLVVTVYRIPVCRAEMAKVKAAWAAMQLRLQHDLEERLAGEEEEEEEEKLAGEEGEEEEEEEAAAATAATATSEAEPSINNTNATTTVVGAMNVNNNDAHNSSTTGSSSSSPAAAGAEQPLIAPRGSATNHRMPTAAETSSTPTAAEDAEQQAVVVAVVSSAVFEEANRASNDATSAEYTAADGGVAADAEPTSRYVKQRRPLATDAYEIDEEEEERALFFSYALVFGTQCASILFDALFIPLLLCVVVTVVRAHRQYRDWFYYTALDAECLAWHRRKSVFFNFLFMWRDLFCTFIVWPLTLLNPIRFVKCLFSLAAAVGEGGANEPKDPVPAIRLYHWGWAEAVGYGWHLKVAGYVDPQGPHAHLLTTAGPSAVSLGLPEPLLWRAAGDAYGSLKVGVVKGMLPITFKHGEEGGGAYTVRVVPPFPLMPTGAVAAVADASDSSAAPDAAAAAVPAANYFAEIDCPTTRVKSKALMGVGRKLGRECPVRLRLAFNKGADTLVDIYTTVGAMMAANSAAAHLDKTLDMTSTMEHNAAVVQTAASLAALLPREGEEEGPVQQQSTQRRGGAAVKELTVDDWAPYACDVWWKISLTALAQTLLDYFALFSFLFAHLVPVRAAVMYYDLFYYAVRRQRISGIGAMRTFVAYYKAHNKGHTALVESYDLHLNNIHKRTITLASGDWAVNNRKSSHLYSLEKRSVGGDVSVFLSEGTAAMRAAKATLPPEVLSLCCVLVNNVLAVCGVVGDKFFADMSALLAFGSMTAPHTMDHCITDNASRNMVNAELRARLMTLHADRRHTHLTLQPNDAMGVTAVEASAGEFPNRYSLVTLSGREEMRRKYITPSLAQGTNAFADDEIAEGVRPMMVDGQLDAVLEAHRVSLALAPAPVELAADMSNRRRAEAEVRRTTAHSSTASTPLAHGDDGATDDAVDAVPLFDTIPKEHVPLPLGELADALATQQEAVLAALEAQLGQWEASASALGWGAFNYDFDQMRVRCMYHAAMAILDVVTLVGILAVCLPLYRIPTLVAYGRHQSRRGHNWRWAILMVLGEYLLDVVFAIGYAICVVSLVEVIYVHQSMWRHWCRHQSFWSLREGIVDALDDLFRSLGRALKGILRCKALYYLLVTAILGIVAPIELATNHFGLSRAKCGCLRGWMVALMGWLALIIIPFAITNGAPVSGDGGASFSPYLYAYIALIAAYLLIFVIVVGVGAKEPRDLIEVSFSFMPLSGRTVGSFLVTVIEVAQLIALPIIVATGARRYGGPDVSEGFTFDGEGRFSWLSDAAHYLFLDHITRFHGWEAGSAITAAEGSSRSTVGYYLSFSVCIFIFFLVALPVVVDTLLGKRSGMAHSPMWRGAVFLGNVAVLFVIRNLVAWLDCSEGYTFDVRTEGPPIGYDNVTNRTIYGAGVNGTYYPMQVGEPSLNFACWYELGPADRVSGAFTLVFVALYCVMLVLKGLRFAVGGSADAAAAEMSGGVGGATTEEIQATFHEVIDTYAAVLYIAIAALSGFLYASPIAFCALHMALLGVAVAAHARNVPWLPFAFPINRIATLWELNAFRNIGYLAAIGTSAVCIAGLKRSEGTVVVDENAESPMMASAVVVSDVYPWAMVGVWIGAALLTAAMLLVSYWFPKALGGAARGVTQWEALQHEAVDFIRTMAAEGRLIPSYSDGGIGSGEKGSTINSGIINRNSKKHRSTRLAALVRRVERASSLAAFCDALIELEGAIHIASYNSNFFVSRYPWWASAIALGRKGIREDTICAAEDLLQSLRNGCMSVRVEEGLLSSANGYGPAATSAVAAMMETAYRPPRAAAKSSNALVYSSTPTPMTPPPMDDDAAVAAAIAADPQGGWREEVLSAATNGGRPVLVYRNIITHQTQWAVPPEIAEMRGDLDRDGAMGYGATSSARNNGEEGRPATPRRVPNVGGSASEADEDGDHPTTADATSSVVLREDSSLLVEMPAVRRQSVTLVGGPSAATGTMAAGQGEGVQVEEQQ